MREKFFLFRDTLIITVLLTLLSGLIDTLFAQNKFDELYQLWKNRRYSEVLPLLLEYREKPYGRNAEIDYMIATSACRLPEVREEGHQYFRWMLSHYSLDPHSRELVENELQICATSDEPLYIAFSTLRAGGGPGVRGKTYYWLNDEKTVEDFQNAAIISNPVEIIRDISMAEFNKRLFEPAERDSAVQFFTELAGTDFSIISQGAFLLAATGQHTKPDLQDIANRLEKYLYFFSAQYQMPVPSHLLTVYLVPDTWRLAKLAEKLHGIKVSSGSIGYSFQNDLSIIGIIPGKAIGTLAHELFHLMVRNNFGDIPPWMDEGMAALYEVSRFEGEKVIGLPNWRGAVLKRFWELRPAVQKLVSMNWESFENAEDDYEARQQAANHAMARYFVLYLQNHQQLDEVYHAFRDRKVEDMKENPAADAVHLLETVLKQPLSEVDEDFSNWFNQPGD